jgi:lipopolysaccharide transport system permease protein
VQGQGISAPPGLSSRCIRQSDFDLSSSIREPIAAPERRADDHVLILREPSDARLRLRDLRGYRPLLRALASRDLKARYKQSALGPAWVVFQPLALLVAFTIGFKSVANVRTEGVPYFLFAMTGLVVWTYFQAAVQASTGSIVNSYALVRWTSCPRLALPLATLVSSSPSFFITAVTAFVAAGIGGYLWLGALLLPLLALWLLVLTGAVAVFLAAISVRARDVLSAVPFLLQVVLFLGPVAYRTSQLSSTLQTVISFNPLTGLIDAWRWALLGIDPDMTAIGLALGVTALLVLIAWKTFAAVEVVMSDEI